MQRKSNSFEPLFLSGVGKRKTEMIGRPPVKVEDRFWSHVVKTPDCWLWNGKITKYKLFRLSTNKQIYVHIFSFVLHNPKYAKTLLKQFSNSNRRLIQVCHSCDVQSCVNPMHLWLGTQKENLADMKIKGRGKWLSGSDNPMWGKRSKGFTGRKHTLKAKKRFSAMRIGIKKINGNYSWRNYHAN
jgi:hypothetical protein